MFKYNEKDIEISVKLLINMVKNKPQKISLDWQKGIPALEIILNEYNQQKQQLTELQAIEEEHRKENGELKKENEKLNAEVIENICYRVDTEVFEEMREELKQEKEKNKNLIKQLQEQNTEIQDISKQLREKEQEDIKIRAKFILSLDDYITKDKIRAKIKELEEKSDYWNCDEIEVLKELLEE